jgi:hypothetical protein
MERAAQISKEKQQSIIILTPTDQSTGKMSSFFKCSSKNRYDKRYDETSSHEDRHRKVRHRVMSAAEDKFIRVTSLRNCIR